MIKTTLAASALVFASVIALAPASAAPVSCSAETLAKTEATAEVLPDTAEKYASFRELMAAQNDILAGNMRGCAIHVSHAIRLNATRPSYAQ